MCLYTTRMCVVPKRSLLKTAADFFWQQRYAREFRMHYSALVPSIYIPKAKPVSSDDIHHLNEFIASTSHLIVVTGAGISTESGIPDYRSEGVGLYARSSHRPVNYADFVSRSDIRKRFWARNYAAWPLFSAAEPNVSHKLLATWERLGMVQDLITQNVDGLHIKAGSRKVVELHGSAAEVICIECGSRVKRAQLQLILGSMNGELKTNNLMLRPDGDVDLDFDVHNFVVPSCTACGGILKPDIVFFGDNVPRWRVDDVNRRLVSSNGVLVLGSSLTVFSAFRIILHAQENNVPIAIVNVGPTRGDKHAKLKIDALCSEVLSKISLQ